jgi:hypothetical protein
MSTTLNPWIESVQLHPDVLRESEGTDIFALDLGPLPSLTSEPDFASIACATCEMIGRLSLLLYFVAELSLELPLPLASWLECERQICCR